MGGGLRVAFVDFVFIIIYIVNVFEKKKRRKDSECGGGG